jgi:hypothetical protein
METLGLVLFGAGLLIALAGCGWTVTTLFRTGFWHGALAVFVMLVFPLACVLGWDWKADLRKGLILTLVVLVISAAWVPMIVARVSLRPGVARKPFLLNFLGVALMLFGAVLVSKVAR